MTVNGSINYRFGRWTVTMIMLAGLVIPTLARAARPATQADDGIYRAEYEVLAERNIFLPQRPARIGRINPPAAPQYTPEQAYVVTGIVRNADERYALVESLLDGSVRKLVAGDTIADGRVVEIEISRIIFERHGRAIPVVAGANLAGSLVRPGKNSIGEGILRRNG